MRIEWFKHRRASVLCLSLGLVAGFAFAWSFGAAHQDVVSEEALAPVDKSAANFVKKHRTPSLTAVMEFVTRLGAKAVVVVMLVFAAALTTAWLRTFRPAAFLTGVVVTGFLLEKSMKAFVHRARPPTAAGVSSGYSFPSGHAIAAAALFGGIAFIVSKYSARAWAVASISLAFLIVLIVAFSRVYLGVHYASDVVAGSILGGAIVAVAASLWTIWERFGRGKRLLMLG